MRLILASASPRRRALLAALGVAFEVAPSHIEESLAGSTDAASLATELALAKARAVSRRIRAAPGGPAVVLGADTLVVLGDRPLGKPASADEARQILAALSGRTHEVITAVALVESAGARELTAVVVSRVAMRPYTPAEIEAYVATAEPYDKAGAYAVQGAGGRLVERVEGCYTNVVGLPVETTARLLRRFGFPALAPR